MDQAIKADFELLLEIMDLSINFLLRVSPMNRDFLNQLSHLWRNEMRSWLQEFYSQHCEVPLYESQFFFERLDDLFNPSDVEASIFWTSSNGRILDEYFERLDISFQTIFQEFAVDFPTFNWNWKRLDLSKERYAALKSFEDRYWNVFIETKQVNLNVYQV